MIDLAALRRLAGVTQVQLADAIGSSQGQISRLEHQEDMLLSTLGAYLTALGLDASVVVDVGGETVAYNLTSKRGNR
ncbi:helix-turn-helix domain-containing protein [Mycobacterium sp. JS623]|uniref:helix-turn-helix domain-containing protein n=1 Tax=Mycobacterium sp. JS623 TaxID=212767 RepID=UPI0002E2D543|nr:helix-turn-helix transcriptional regulator [Mycobacterium sp. JS623]